MFLSQKYKYIFIIAAMPNKAEAYAAVRISEPGIPYR